MRAALLVVLAFAAAIGVVSANAIERGIWFNVGALSYHPDRDKHYNERNVGFGLEYQFNARHALAAGRYKNSYFQTSNFAYYAWTPLEFPSANLGIVRVPSLRIGLLAGALDGYRRNSGRMAPVALPIAMREWRHVGVNLTAVPHVGDVDGGVAAELLDGEKNDTHRAGTLAWQSQSSLTGARARSGQVAKTVRADVDPARSRSTRDSNCLR
jgi:hypothetical protein